VTVKKHSYKKINISNKCCFFKKTFYSSKNPEKVFLSTKSAY